MVSLELSVAAMGVASIGLLPPVIGAVRQKGIDVAVILNALRAPPSGDARRASMPPQAAWARFG